jgi:hypothetical protein
MILKVGCSQTQNCGCQMASARREVGVFSETVSYADIDCVLAEPLDHILDGICIVPEASKQLFP